MTRLLLFLATVAAILGGLADAARPVPERVTTQVAIGAIHVYQATVSRIYAKAGVQCRFTPTCSHYGEVCVREFGMLRGGWLALTRVVRCGPWTPVGTVDPPPVAGAAARVAAPL